MGKNDRGRGVAVSQNSLPWSTARNGKRDSQGGYGVLFPIGNAQGVKHGQIPECGQDGLAQTGIDVESKALQARCSQKKGKHSFRAMCGVADCLVILGAQLQAANVTAISSWDVINELSQSVLRPQLNSLKMDISNQIRTVGFALTLKVMGKHAW